MMVVPAGVKVHLALGYTSMRKGLDGLAALVQEQLRLDPFSGHLFAFRGRNASLLKVLFWDGNGLCLFTKRIDTGGFVWPRITDPGGTVTLSPAQLAADRGHRLALPRARLAARKGGMKTYSKPRQSHENCWSDAHPNRRFGYAARSR